MATFIIRTTFRPSFQQVTHKFRAAREKMRGQQRESMRELGRLLVAAMRNEAPKGKTGNFAKKIAYRTFERGEAITVNVYMPQPLGDYIRFGTKAHAIRARSARALSFDWPKIGAHVVVPKMGGFKTHMRNGVLWVGKGFVWHPGTKANRFDLRAKSRWQPNAIVQLKKMGRAFVIEVTK